MYDLIIIGAGTAGISAYNQAVKHTQNILVINAGAWDTTCARVGCMPSKVLIAAANRMHEAQHLQTMGIGAEQQLFPARVMQHVRQLRDRFSAATLKQINAWPSGHKCSGHAQFINANTVSVDSKHYQAKAFIIAVGSKPHLNTDWQLQLGDRLISTDHIFELPHLPKALAIVGSGVIALELALALHRLGVQVDVFARSQRLGLLTSPHLQALAQQYFSQQLRIYWKTLPSQLKRHHQGVQLKFERAQGQLTQHYDYVLQATGRCSNLDTLQLDRIDLAYADSYERHIDPQTGQLGQHPIFVLGDAHSSRPVQHEAAFAGRQAALNVLTGARQSIYLPTPLAIAFSEPQMAIAGASHAQLQQQQINFVTGTSDYRRQGRALVMDQAHGAVEVYVDAHTGQLLGAELLCASAEHLAHLLAWMIDSALNIQQILEKPFYHPTLEEGLRTALKHARRQLNVKN